MSEAPFTVLTALCEDCGGEPVTIGVREFWYNCGCGLRICSGCALKDNHMEHLGSR